MNSHVSKWKMSTYILAATTLAALYYGQGASEGSDDPTQVRAAKRDASHDSRMSSLSRLRIPAAMAGIDERQLLRDLKSAGSISRITMICERLAVFGTDISLEPLRELSKRNPQAAGPAMLAMGGIGSDRATDELLDMMTGGERFQQEHVIRALAKTKNPRAELQIMEWAQGGERTRRLHAVEALGSIGGPEALALLQALAQSHDSEVVRRVLVAAGEIGSGDAVAILQEIADGGSRSLRIAALRQMPSNLEESEQEWLINVLAADDPQCASAAAIALGRAQVRDALPLILDAARTGPPSLQQGAVTALALLGGEEAQEAIIELFESANQQNAYRLGHALLNSGSEGKATFLAAMRKGHRVRQQLLYLLDGLGGDEVVEIRMHIARTGNPQEKLMVLGQLAGSEEEEVVDLILDLARTGPTQVRSRTMQILAQSGDPRARTALLEMARGSGTASIDALRILGNGAMQSSETSDVLIDALHSGSSVKMQTAGWALASDGSVAGRAALLAAMRSDDPRLARIATEAASELVGMPEVNEALHDLAMNSKDEQLKASALQQLVMGGSGQANALVIDAIREGTKGAENLISSVVMRAGPESSQVMAEAAKSGSSRTRAALANALSSRGGDEESMRVLAQLSGDEDESVKSAAIYSYSNLGTRESVDRLLELAASGSKSTQQAAISVIGNTGDPRATQVVADAITSDSSELAQSAMYSAQNMGPEVDEALLRLAENSEADDSLRQQAVYTLISRGADVDAATLETLKRDTGAGDEDDDGGYVDHHWGHH